MAYEIGRAHKLGKKNRNQLDNTADPSSSPSTNLYIYGKSNEDTDIGRIKESPQINTLEKIVLYTINLLLLFKTNLHPKHTQKTY